MGEMRKKMPGPFVIRTQNHNQSSERSRAPPYRDTNRTRWPNRSVISRSSVPGCRPAAPPRRPRPARPRRVRPRPGRPARARRQCACASLQLAPDSQLQHHAHHSHEPSSALHQTDDFLPGRSSALRRAWTANGGSPNHGVHRCGAGSPRYRADQARRRPGAIPRAMSARFRAWSHWWRTAGRCTLSRPAGRALTVQHRGRGRGHPHRAGRGGAAR